MPTKLTAIESALPLLPSSRAKALAASSRVELTRQNLAKHVTISLHMEPETRRPGEHFDSQAVEWIHAELDNGNQWAWCVVTVTAGYEIDEDTLMRGIAVLGGNSYESREAFERDNLEQMTSEALDDLWAQLEARTPTGRAKALANGSHQAITTGDRDVGGTNPRVIARCEAKRISVPWDHALDAGANHAAVALQLMDQLGWSEKNDLVMGGTREGYVFVQVPKRSK